MGKINGNLVRRTRLRRLPKRLPRPLFVVVVRAVKFVVAVMVVQRVQCETLCSLAVCVYIICA